MIAAAGHQLNMTWAPQPLFVYADLTRLAQVFANLLNNAAKYTPDGGRIDLIVEEDEQQVVITVRDNGVGIPQSMLPRVFEMFTQVDRSLENSQGGLGVGLSIVKGLVELHGGQVYAASPGHGQGSEFTVRLPRIHNVEPVRTTGTVRPRNGTAKQILVVDDNRDAAVSLALMMRMLGHETRTAHDGLEALDQAAEFRPDVVLLDIGMPRLNGYDTARRMRETEWGRSCFLIALTGWGQEEDRRRSREAGFDAHLIKPVDPAALESMLNHIPKQALRSAGQSGPTDSH
ncbi:MAG: ATP-binding protein [Pirellulales bacterium]